jgi:hypothetical protein
MAGNVSPTRDMPPREELMKKDFGFYASGKLESLTKIPYEQLIEEEFVWVGTPEQIKKKVAKLIEDCPGVTEVSVLCTYAGMEHWRTIRTQELFAAEVMPNFAD